MRFDDVAIPAFDIGGGRTLNALQRVDLIGDSWDAGAAQLVAGVLRILEISDAREAPSGAASSETLLKAALRDPNGDIALSDILLPLAEKVRKAIANDAAFPVTSDVLGGAPVDVAFYVVELVDEYIRILDPALDALITTASWARDLHLQTLTRFVERLTPPSADGPGMAVLTSLRWFPVLPVLYAGALAAVHQKNYGALRAIAIDAKVHDLQDGRIPMIARGHPWRPFSHFELPPQILAFRASGEEVDREMAEALRNRRRGNRYTPVSDYLHDSLRPRLRTLVPDDEEYSELFDRTEILLGLLSSDLELQHKDSRIYVDGPVFGRFTWRDRYTRPEDKPDAQMQRELVEQQEAWQPLQTGLFGGSVSRALAAFDAFLKDANEARTRRW